MIYTPPPSPQTFLTILIKSDFLILQSLRTAASETQRSLFRDTTQLLLRFVAVLGSVDTIQQCGKRNRVKVRHMQPVEKLMLLIFNLRAKFDQLTFPVFSLSQLGDFRTTKPQFQSKNMLVNLDIMPFLKLIRFIINRESTAFRLILDCP